MVNSSSIYDATLSSLFDLNSDYDNLIKLYEKKIEVTQKFQDKIDFIKQEISRIKDFYLQPLNIKIESNIKSIHLFNYSDYSKYAYDWLSMGNDLKLSQIISNAEIQYLQGKPTEIKFNKKEFSDALIANLRKGVAYLAYERFFRPCGCSVKIARRDRCPERRQEFDK